MLRLPVYEFSKRVDDTVAHAMTILQTREDYTARRSELTPAAEPREGPAHGRGSGGARRFRSRFSL
jgi:hypothetical protein